MKDEKMMKLEQQPANKEEKEIDFVKEFSIEDVWTTGCALNTTGKIDN